MNSERADEELLRELASRGDLSGIEHLLNQKPRLNLNSQNAMNGWTALHWAAKRNHRQVVEYLLAKGADKSIQAHDTSTAARFCSNDALRSILQSNDETSLPDSTLPIVPNYLRNPVFPYILPSTMTNPSFVSSVSNETITLLCRIADDPSETDFIEFDFTKNPVQGGYQRLIQVLCEEFHLAQIEKIRRLPHIRIRHDRDVERLKENQMLEIVRLSSNTGETTTTTIT